MGKPSLSFDKNGSTCNFPFRSRRRKKASLNGKNVSEESAPSARMFLDVKERKRVRGKTSEPAMIKKSRRAAADGTSGKKRVLKKKEETEGGRKGGRFAKTISLTHKGEVLRARKTAEKRREDRQERTNRGKTSSKRLNCLEERWGFRWNGSTSRTNTIRKFGLLRCKKTGQGRGKKSGPDCGGGEIGPRG